MTREQLENIIKNAEEDKLLAEERAEKIKAEQDKRIADAKMQLENMDGGYERRKDGEVYYFVDGGGSVSAICERNSFNNFNHFEIGNCMSKENAQRMAKKVKLMFLLDRFTRENGWDDRLWENGEATKWYIYQEASRGSLSISSTSITRFQGAIYFASRQICEQAIEKYHDLILEVMQSEKKPVEKKSKTYLDDLLEKYPDAKLLDNGVPYTCANNLGYVAECGSGCKACWNQEMEEM